jgi:hypothetical protein
VAAGDVNGDGKDEIVTMGKFGVKNVVRTFNFRGQKLSEFSLNSQFANTDLGIATVDINFDRKAEIVVEGN